MSSSPSKTAQAAAKWWGERLQQGDRATFERVIAEGVDAEFEKCVDAGISPRAHLDCDYDPQGLLLEAVRAAGIECRGCMFSANGILPQKHSLRVSPGLLRPKEGYGTWTDDIVVKEDP